MNKRLTIFDLQEGKVYAAFDGGRRLPKNYTVTDGKLQNASKDEDPNDLSTYQGCSWVPMKASIGFEELKGASTGSTKPVSLLGLKKGIAYRASAQIDGLVARKGGQLVILDGKKKPVRPIDLERINLTTMFTMVEVLPKAKKAKRKVSRAVIAKSKSKKSARSSARR